MSLTKSNTRMLDGSIPDSQLESGVGTSANNLVKLDADAKLPAVDGSQLTNVSAGYGNGSSPSFADITASGDLGVSGNGSFGATSSSGYRLLYYLGGMYAGSDINLQGNLDMANGNINCYSLTVGGTFTNNSDDRLKDKSGNIPTPLDKISTLNGFYYTDSDTVTDLKKAENLQDPSDDSHKKESRQKVGLSAQEVQAVLPEVVSNTEAENSKTGTEYLTLDYTRIVPLLVEGIKELKAKVEALENA